jgi:hypothetical protein
LSGAKAELLARGAIEPLVWPTSEGPASRGQRTHWGYRDPVTDTSNRVIGFFDVVETIIDAELFARATDDVARRQEVLRNGALVRVGLYALPAGSTGLSIIVHHAAGDSWSLGVAIAELDAAYRGLANGVVAALPTPPISYRDYAHWEARGAESAAAESGRSFWDSLLSEWSPGQLPPDHDVSGAPGEGDASYASAPSSVLRRLFGATRLGHEASHGGWILLSRFGFDTGGDVDAPRLYPADRLGDVVGPQAASEQDLVLRDEVADDAPVERDATTGDDGIDHDDVGGVLVDGADRRALGSHYLDHGLYARCDGGGDLGGLVAVQLGGS